MALSNLGQPYCRHCYTMAGLTFDPATNAHFCSTHHPSAGAQYGISGTSNQQISSGGGFTPYPGNSGAGGVGAQQNPGLQGQAGIAIYGGFSHPINPTPVKRKPLRFGEIKAYRAWAVVDGHLRSVSADRFWAPHHVMSAMDGWRENDTGIHSFKDPGRAMDFCWQHRSAGNTYVYGGIEIWGDIYEFELGYQSEFAQVTRLIGNYSDMPHEAFLELKARYDEKADVGGIPLCAIKDAQAKQIRGAPEGS